MQHIICFSKGIGISVNPPPTCDLRNYGRNIVIYNAFNGTVYGGSQPQRNVNLIQRTDGNRPESIYRMELDLSNRTFAIEQLNGEKIIIDPKIGDYEYSPVVMFGNTGSVKVRLL